MTGCTLQFLAAVRGLACFSCHVPCQMLLTHFSSLMPSICPWVSLHRQVADGMYGVLSTLLRASWWLMLRFWCLAA